MQKADVDRLLMKPTAQKRLGKYLLLGRLGHGGMGKIYLAYAPGPGGVEKLLVIKRLHSHLTGDPVLVNNFLDEARLSMALTHPNIVHTYDVGEVDGRYFIVMEYIDGQNLGVLLRTAKRSGKYPDSTMWAGLFIGVLDALHAAHTARDPRGRPLHIIHRDVSPQNVLVTYDGMPKLVDFGIAKAAMRISETDAGVLKGKYSYMSPEQCQSLQIDPRSDVFSAGIVMWEMLAGRRLYKADSIVKSVERIMTEAPISPVRVNPECDAELSKVVLKALAKKPEERYASAEDFRYAIDDALHKGRHFRQTEVRDLMERLFGDVRQRQQQLLEECLAGAATPSDDEHETDDGDSDSHGSVARGSESESDMLVPNLRLAAEQETTTPSKSQRSPLVTQEEEEPPGGPRSLPVPASAASSSSSALTGGLHAPIALDGPSPTVTIPKPASRGTLVAVGAGIGAVVLAALAVAIGFLSGRTPDEEVVDDVIAVEAASPAPDPVVAQAAAAIEQQPVVVEHGAEGVAERAAVPEPVEAAPLQRQPSEGARDDDDWDEKKSRRTSARPKSAAKSSAKADKLDDAPLPKSAAVEERAAPVENAEEAGGATLTLETVPWSIVYLGKKKLGETPLVNVPIPAGDLELLLVNPEKNIKQPYFLKAAAGKSYRKRLKLD